MPLLTHCGEISEFSTTQQEPKINPQEIPFHEKFHENTHKNSLDLFPYLNDLKNNNEFLFEETIFRLLYDFFKVSMIFEFL